MHRIFNMPFAEVYPAYVNKVQRKGRSLEELHEVITWLTGFDERILMKHISENTNIRDFFAEAVINLNAILITGSICGVKIQEIQDPLMLKIRYLDKLVDELAKGKSLEKILRK